jgi:hypothetical protein
VPWRRQARIDDVTMNPNCPLSPAAKLVYLYLAQIAKFDTGEAWPKQESICEATRLGETAMRRGLKELEATGYMLTPRKGLHEGVIRTVYTLKPVTEASPYKPLPRATKGTRKSPGKSLYETAEPAERPSHSEGSEPVHSEGSEPSHSEGATRAFRGSGPADSEGSYKDELRKLNLGTNVGRDAAEDDGLFAVEQPTKQVARAGASGFDAFWAVYPRKVAKEGARKAYAAAVRQVGTEVILEGARRYAADPNRVQQFTKHPTTWLRQGCWDDEPEPMRHAALDDTAGTGRHNNAGERRVASFRSALEEARALEDRGGMPW